MMTIIQQTNPQQRNETLKPEKARAEFLKRKIHYKG